MTTSLVREESQEPQLESIENELGGRYPDVDVDLIHNLVAESYERLTPAKVAIYLPILVTHEVRDELKDLGVA